MSVQAPYCMVCKHYRDDDVNSCTAFPKGIPKEIFEGSREHFERLPGDKGITFEVASGKEQMYKLMKSLRKR